MGLGNPRAIRALLRLLRLENPHLVFLMETRLSEHEMEKVRIKCGFACGIMVGCKGSGKERSGGLALMWNDQINISIISFSLNHIHGRVEDENGGDP
jgi:hypothetical protein